MKKFLSLIIIFSLLSFSCCGQCPIKNNLVVRDTVYRGVGTVNPIINAPALTLTGAGTTGTLTLSAEYYKWKNDTVRCIILLSDTLIKVYSINATGTIKTGDWDEYFGRKVYWQFGYEVTRYDNWSSTTYCIDENKQPFRKSIIIWQSKTIK